MTLLEKAKQFAQEHADKLDMREQKVVELFIEEQYCRVADVFEELLQDRTQIKELRDFWRNRAGLPIPDENE